MFHTGFPFSCLVASGRAIDTSANFEEDVCSIVPGVSPKGPRTIQQWFNVNAFRVATDTEVLETPAATPSADQVTLPLTSVLSRSPP